MITENDERAIRRLGEVWETAWNTHDMPLLASLVTPGVDFVTVMGAWLGGREIFQKYHTAIHETQFERHATPSRNSHPATNTSPLKP
jgi:uncharacterized protein (TIGR02246 family)